ncbi:MAG: efflux RND transporter periplasmic adaptor subunit [Polyangiaceae bacterium]|nr:efflux RND transporter periplasmic adaptor subunit [Polyangiaceae bacterium]
MRWAWSTLTVVCCLACSKEAPHREHGGHSDPAAPGSSHEAEHGEIPKKVSLSAEVVAAAGIRSEAARRSQLDTGLSLPGEVVVDPDKSARIASPVSGRLERVDFREGQLVKKGHVLATVRVPELGRLRASRTVAQAKSKAARANAKRLRALADKGLASEQQALDATTEADTLEAEAAGIASQMGAMGAGGGSTVALRASVSGTVLFRDAVVGQPLSPEQTLGTIADLSEVWFVARVFEKDLGRLRVGARADIELNAYARRTFPGTVEYIGQQVDPVARTLTARIRLANPEQALRVGLFGTARVTVTDADAGAEVLTVPHAAVTEVAGKAAVFVRHRDNEFELHEVVLGRVGVGGTEVVSGLRAGEDVVVEGVFSVKSALLRSTFSEEEH